MLFIAIILDISINGGSFGTCIGPCNRACFEACNPYAVYDAIKGIVSVIPKAIIAVTNNKDDLSGFTSIIKLIDPIFLIFSTVFHIKTVMRLIILESVYWIFWLELYWMYWNKEISNNLTS